MNGSVMNMVCYERDLLWTRSVMNWSVMNVVCFQMWSVINVVCYERVCYELVCYERGLFSNVVRY